MYKFYNPNPSGKFVDDCVIRAISKTENKDWDTIYLEICLHGFMKKNMPSTNKVWGSYLLTHGYRQGVIPNTCPDCYTIKDFCQDNPKGTFILATGEHVVAVIDGVYYDAGDSGYETVLYYWKKGV